MWKLCTCSSQKKFSSFRVRGFGTAAKGFWNDISNRKVFLEELAKTLGFKEMEDWYNIKMWDFMKYGKNGKDILSVYGASPSKVLQSTFTDYKWKPWKFLQVPKGFWDDINNRREYLHQLGTRLGYKNMEDWYKISRRDLTKNDGGGLLDIYGFSLFQVIQSTFPEYNWKPWKFSHAPKGYWKDVSNRKEYLEDLALKLGYKDMKDWYKINQQEFINYDGGGLLKTFGNSPFKVLETTFSEYHWKPWNFSQVPKGFWEDESNLFRYFEEIGKLLEKTKETWERTSVYSLRHYKINSIILTWGSLQKALQAAYPTTNWNFSPTSKGQQFLRKLSR